METGEEVHVLGDLSVDILCLPTIPDGGLPASEIRLEEAFTLRDGQHRRTSLLDAPASAHLGAHARSMAARLLTVVACCTPNGRQASHMHTVRHEP